MSSKKISELNAATTINDGDEFPVVTEGSTKRVRFQTLKDNILENLPTGSSVIHASNHLPTTSVLITERTLHIDEEPIVAVDEYTFSYNNQTEDSHHVEYRQILDYAINVPFANIFELLTTGGDGIRVQFRHTVMIEETFVVLSEQYFDETLTRYRNSSGANITNDTKKISALSVVTYDAPPGITVIVNKFELLAVEYLSDANADVIVDSGHMVQVRVQNNQVETMHNVKIFL